MAKKPVRIKCKCMDCKLATILLWGNDPAIAQCPVRNCKEVANTIRICEHFVAGINKKIKMT